MIKVENLTIAYSNKNSILKNININFQKGDRIGIVGPNGSGKTSFIEVLLNLNKNFSGKFEIDDDLKKNTKNVFQEVEYDKELSLLFMYKNYSRIAGLKLSDLNEKVFEKYGLGSKIKNKYNTLSGGEKQKFKLLMALECRPQLLILDEISTSLDSLWKVQILNIIKAYLEKYPETILIIISHDYKELKELTNGVFLIKNKKFIEITNLENYFQNFNEREVTF